MIQDLPADPGALRISPLVLHDRTESNGRGIAFHTGSHVRFPSCKMQRVGLSQPNVAINPRALVEPSVAKAGVHADDQKILSAEVCEISEVETEWSVAVVVASDEVSIQKYERAAKGSVELHANTPPGVFFAKIERTPVPADARLRISAPERLIAMILLLFVAHEGQLYRPVMRQVQAAPLRIVELSRGKLEFAALSEVSLAHTESEVATRIRGVTLEELPIKIQQKSLAGSNSAGKFRGGDAGILRQQCLCALYRTAD